MVVPDKINFVPVFFAGSVRRHPAKGKDIVTLEKGKGVFRRETLSGQNFIFDSFKRHCLKLQ